MLVLGKKEYFMIDIHVLLFSGKKFISYAITLFLTLRETIFCHIVFHKVAVIYEKTRIKAVFISRMLNVSLLLLQALNKNVSLNLENK